MWSAPIMDLVWLETTSSLIVGSIADPPRISFLNYIYLNIKMYII